MSYCGIGKNPRKLPLGSAEYCLNQGKVNYYGLKELPPLLKKKIENPDLSLPHLKDEIEYKINDIRKTTTKIESYKYIIEALDGEIQTHEEEIERIKKIPDWTEPFKRKHIVHVNKNIRRIQSAQRKLSTSIVKLQNTLDKQELDKSKMIVIYQELKKRRDEEEKRLYQDFLVRQKELDKANKKLEEEKKKEKMEKKKLLEKERSRIEKKIRKNAIKQVNNKQKRIKDMEESIKREKEEKIKNREKIKKVQKKLGSEIEELKKEAKKSKKK